MGPGDGRQGALMARCGGARACVEPRWQPEENDRGRARPLELLGQPSVTYYRAPLVSHEHGMETSRI